MTNLEVFWQQNTDEALSDAARHLEDYTEETQRVILAEMRRRGLAKPQPAHCVGCGRVLSVDYLYCPGCGRSLLELEHPSVLHESARCPGCGRVASPDYSYCPACGRSLLAREPSSVPDHCHHPLDVPPPQQTAATASNNIQAPETSGPQVRPWVRYWARIVDLQLFGLFLGLVAGVVYPPALRVNEMLLVIVNLFVYVFVEPIMLTSWGTTPGKALLRVRVRKSTGDKPTYGEALARSFSVWLRGFGLGIPLVSLITLITAHQKLTRNGITTWDKDGGFTVSHRTIGAPRVISVIVLLVAFLFLLALGKLDLSHAWGQA